MSKKVSPQEVRVNYRQLVNVLMLVERGTFCNLVSNTVPTMRKTNNPFVGRVRKINSVNYYLGGNYQKRVNVNMEKEGIERNFVSQKPKGKTHVSECVLLDDKTGLVHYCMVERFDEIKTNPVYMLDGVEMSNEQKTEMFSFFPPRYEVKSQSQEKKVFVITPKVENIQSITIDHKKYILVD